MVLPIPARLVPLSILPQLAGLALLGFCASCQEASQETAVDPNQENPQSKIVDYPAPEAPVETGAETGADENGEGSDPVESEATSASESSDPVTAPTLESLLIPKVLLSWSDAPLTETRKEELQNYVHSEDPTIQAIAVSLLYWDDKETYWPELVKTFGVRDYLERAEGKYNMQSGAEMQKTINTIEKECGANPHPGHPLLASFLHYRDKNLWLQPEKGDRVSMARFLRGAYFSVVFGNGDDSLGAANRIDAAVKKEMGVEEGPK